MKVLVAQSNSLQPLGLWLTRLLCPWDSSGKNTGVGCHSLPQGTFLIRDLPDPGMEPGSPALQADSSPSEPPGKPSQMCFKCLHSLIGQLRWGKEKGQKYKRTNI